MSTHDGNVAMHSALLHSQTPAERYPYPARLAEDDLALYRKAALHIKTRLEDGKTVSTASVQLMVLMAHIDALSNHDPNYNPKTDAMDGGRLG